MDRHLLERALAAHAARGRRVERARAGLVQQRAGDLDRVARELGGRPGGARAVDQPLAVQEPERELLVVARRAHRDRERRAVDADLERLLDRDLVLDPGCAYGGVGAADMDLGHGGVASVRSSRYASASSASSSLTLSAQPRARVVDELDASAAARRARARRRPRAAASRRSLWRARARGAGGDAREVAVPEADELERVVERAGRGPPLGAPRALGELRLARACAPSWAGTRAPRRAPPRPRSLAASPRRAGRVEQRPPRPLGCRRRRPAARARTPRRRRAAPARRRARARAPARRRRARAARTRRRAVGRDAARCSRCASSRRRRRVEAHRPGSARRSSAAPAPGGRSAGAGRRTTAAPRAS